MQKPARNTICLWYDGDAEDAARFYARTFPDSSVGAVLRVGRFSVGEAGRRAQSVCGWCKDKWGLSCQIAPIALTQAIADPDPAAAKRAFDAMMGMTKLDVAAIEAAPRVGGRKTHLLHEEKS